MNATLAGSDLVLLVRVVLRLSRAFHAALDEPLESKLNLNVKELTVLAAIIDGDQYPSLIAARHQLPAPTVTRLLSRLIDLGLVRRVTEPDDLRKFRLELTEEGMRTRLQTRRDSERILQEVFGHLPADRVRRALKAVCDVEESLLVGEKPVP